VNRFSAAADPFNPDDLYDLLADAVLRSGGSDTELAEYEMQLRRAGNDELVTTFVVPRLRRRSR